MNKERSLSTTFFSKEFPSNWEVEWKANLATEDPYGFIVSIREASYAGLLKPFYEAKFMGNMPTGIQYQNLWFHYYGHIKDGIWVRDLVLVQPPDTPILVPQLKGEAPDIINASEHNVVLRTEKKGGLTQVIPLKKLAGFLNNFQGELGHSTQFMGTIDRERCAVYLTNCLTRRNFSLVADISHERSKGRNKCLSQIEIEYKGISGISSPTPLNQKDVLHEFDELSSKIVNLFDRGVIQPTKTTKLDWLVETLNL